MFQFMSELIKEYTDYFSLKCVDTMVYKSMENRANKILKDMQSSHPYKDSDGYRTIHSTPEELEITYISTVSGDEGIFRELFESSFLESES